MVIVLKVRNSTLTSWINRIDLFKDEEKINKKENKVKIFIQLKKGRVFGKENVLGFLEK